jgi:hypothetical protein
LHQGVPSAETKGFVMSAEDNGETRKKSWNYITNGMITDDKILSIQMSE